jgi:hypothetical protein
MFYITQGADEVYTWLMSRAEPVLAHADLIGPRHGTDKIAGRILPVRGSKHEPNPNHDPTSFFKRVVWAIMSYRATVPGDTRPAL